MQYLLSLMAKRISADKKRHFVAGIPLGAFLQFVLHYFFPAYPVSVIIASFLLLTLICYGFELFSLVTGFGHYEFNDAIAGIFGGIIGILFCRGMIYYFGW